MEKETERLKTMLEKMSDEARTELEKINEAVIHVDNRTYLKGIELNARVSTLAEVRALIAMLK